MKKVLTGLLTFLPVVFYIVYIVWFMASIFNTTLSVMDEPFALNESDFIVTLIIFYLVTILMMLFRFGLLIFYVIDVYRNERIDKKMAIIWVSLLALFSLITMAVYWVIHILLAKPIEKTEVMEVAITEAADVINK